MQRHVCFSLVKHARFVSGYHVFDINEGVLASVSFEHLQCFVY